MYKQNQHVLPVNQQEGWYLWRRWVVLNLCAELLGLSLAILLTVVLDWLWTFLPVPIQVPMGLVTMLLAGVVVGLMIGLAQWFVLHLYLQTLTLKNWLVVTTAGIVIGWFLGTFLGGNINLETLKISMGMLVLSILLLSATLGALLGFFQWLILRHILSCSSLWIVANSLAWMLGLVIAFTGAGLLPGTLTLPAMVLLGGLIALMAACAIGSVHGLIIVYLFRFTVVSVPTISHEPG